MHLWLIFQSHLPKSKSSSRPSSLLFCINKYKKAEHHFDVQPFLVLRAGIEPAQVSLLVFETNASTDSAIGAAVRVSRANIVVFASAKIVLFSKLTKPMAENLLRCHHFTPTKRALLRFRQRKTNFPNAYLSEASVL